jgi:hypothetical protein
MSKVQGMPVVPSAIFVEPHHAQTNSWDQNFFWAEIFSAQGLADAPEQWRWSSYRFYLLDESGPVRVNQGWTKISFRDRVA